MPMSAEETTCALCGHDLQEEAQDTGIHQACKEATAENEDQTHIDADTRLAPERDLRAERVLEIWGKRV